MKRTTIYLDADLEVRLKTEGRRRNQPVAELVREAVEAYLEGPAAGPPGAGAFASGTRDTAARVDDVLTQTGFGEDRPHTRSTRQRRPAARPARARRP